MSSPAESQPIAAGGLVRRIWRAPQADRAAVIVPAWSDAPAVATTNAARLAALSGDVQGQSWTALRDAARSQCLAAAGAYLSELGFGTDAASPAGPVIVDGHQPELFHAGVWAKNFAVQALARRTQGVGLHLIVDNDTLARPAIRVPAGEHTQPRRDWLPFDAPQPVQPWEEVRVADSAFFASFADRVATTMQPWGVEPVAASIWPAAVDALRRGGNLVAALTLARMTAERNWQAGNLELPLSRVCELPTFLWFAAAILARAGEFARHHNTVLAEYRKLNHIRSRSHPVPELATTTDGWTEAPFWIWRAGDVRRDRLFVCCQGEELWLRNRDEVVLRLALTPDRSAATAVEQLQTLASFGWRLRTRALTTTLFARLCLADLFVHGLGGAKYDEMTDALMARFFHVPPPEFLTVTATRHLPLGEVEPVTAEDIGGLKHTAWDLTHNPQRYLTSSTDSETVALIAERQGLVQTLLTETDRHHRAVRRQAYRRVHEITARLAERLSDRRAAVAAEVGRLEQHRAANRILQSREYSWVLFPAERLRDYYRELFG